MSSLYQFEEDAAEDMMVRVLLSKAMAKHGDKLLVAALGATQKSVEENTFSNHRQRHARSDGEQQHTPSDPVEWEISRR